MPDLCFIAASDSIRYGDYKRLPINRLELFKNLTQLRMVYVGGEFCSTLDIFNKVIFGKLFDDAEFPERRDMLNIWNLPSLNAPLAINPLLQLGVDCKIINNFDAEFDLLLHYSSQMSIPIICVSTTFILQWGEVARICKKIRKNIPQAILILGGAFVYNQVLNQDPSILKSHMEKSNIDYVLYNCNSDVDLSSLFICITSGGKPEKISGMAWLDKEGVWHATEQKWVQPDLKTHLLWEKILVNNRNKIVQMRTSVGCPFSCAFCNYSSSAIKYSLSDLSWVKSQLDKFDKLGITHIIFTDDNINVPAVRFKKFLSLLNSYSFKWYAFCRVQYIDPETANAMAESGCDGVFLGLESGSDGILIEMNKKATIDDYLKGISHLKDQRIITLGSFILGFPGESTKTINETISFIKSSGLDFYQLKEWYYLKNSPVYNIREQYNLTGFGNVWSHLTMDSTKASQEKLRVFQNINNDCIHIDPDTGLWLLAYLRSSGYSWNQIYRCLSIINEMISLDNNQFGADKNHCLDELKSVILQ